MRIQLSLCIGLLLLSPASLAGECLKVREDGRHACMRFSQKNINNAREYGLQLGSTSTEVMRHLEKRGWTVDQEYLDLLRNGRQNQDHIVCGGGKDASCTSAFKLGPARLVLIFSGANPDAALFGVTRDDAFCRPSQGGKDSFGMQDLKVVYSKLMDLSPEHDAEQIIGLVKTSIEKMPWPYSRIGDIKITDETDLFLRTGQDAEKLGDMIAASRYYRSVFNRKYFALSAVLKCEK